MSTGRVIAPLTSLRFFFALMVFGSHLEFSKGGAPQGWIRFYDAVLREGYVGVSFFFALSGFVLAYNYKARIIAGTTGLREFWIGRFSRVYPLHIASLFLVLPLTLWEIHQGAAFYVAKFVANAGLVHALIPIKDVYFSFNWPAWSISTEAFFYIAFPFLITLLFSRRNAFRVAASVAALALLLFSMHAVPEAHRHFWFYISPVSRIADFMLGIWLYLLYEFLQRKRRTPPPPAPGLGAEAVALGVSAAFFVFHSYVPQVYRYSVYYWIPVSLLIGVFSMSSGPFARLLSHPRLVQLGEVSFAFYLLHQIVIRYFYEFLKFGPNRGFAWISPILVVTLGASYAAFFLDKRAVKLLRRSLTKRFTAKPRLSS